MKNASNLHQPHENWSICLGAMTLRRQVVKIRMGNGMRREWNGIEWNRMVWEYNGIRVGIGLQQFSIKLKLKEYPGHWYSSPVAIALNNGKSELKCQSSNIHISLILLFQFWSLVFKVS